MGLGAVAGVLYLLQRLRVRHDELVVVTNLFWREATLDTRARSLVERFRHPLAYLMALLVAGLCWLGVARPDSVRDLGQQHVLLLDGSARMAMHGRFERAATAAEAELARLPRDRTTVLFCGARVRSLLAPGEDRALFRARLGGLSVEAAPSSVGRAIRSMLPTVEGPHEGDIGVGNGDQSSRRREFIVFGDAPLPEDLRARLASEKSLRRVPLVESSSEGSAGPETAGANRGITALGVSPAQSGAWSRVDVQVDLRSPDSSSALMAEAIAIELDGARVAPGLREDLGGGHVRITLSDLPAAGGLLRLELASGDSLRADDVAALRLPDRPPIRVAFADELDAGLAAQLRAVLRADLAIQIVPNGEAADVRLGDSSSTLSRPFAAAAPAIVGSGPRGHPRGGDSDRTRPWARVSRSYSAGGRSAGPRPPGRHVPGGRVGPGDLRRRGTFFDAPDLPVVRALRSRAHQLRREPSLPLARRAFPAVVGGGRADRALRGRGPCPSTLRWSSKSSHQYFAAGVDRSQI